MYKRQEWNKYKFSGYKVREYSSGRSLWFTDPDKYHRYFFDTVDCKELTPEDEKWITEEISLTMPWTGIELHLDTCHTDTMSCVEQFTVCLLYTSTWAKTVTCWRKSRKTAKC